MTEDIYNTYDKFLYKFVTPNIPNVPTFSNPGQILPDNIDSGQINGNLDIVRGYIQSSNFVSGSAGWRINASGDIEMNSGTFRGNLQTTGGTITISNTSVTNTWIQINNNQTDRSSAIILQNDVSKRLQISQYGSAVSNIFGYANVNAIAITSIDPSSGHLFIGHKNVAANAKIVFGTNNNEQMTIDSAGTINFINKFVKYNNAAPTNGQIFIGNTATGTWDVGTITAGTNISVTNAGGSITIANTMSASISSATANGAVYATAATTATSTAALTNGQLLVGSTGVAPVAATLTGTSNQITVTNGAGTITLSTPQNIHTSATPQFSTLGLGAAASASIPFIISLAGTAASIKLTNTTAAKSWNIYCYSDGHMYWNDNAETTLFRFFQAGGVSVGTGGDHGTGTVTVSSGLYLGTSVYTNPDYALEYWATGKIEKFAKNQGAKDYQRMTLEEIEQYVKEHYHLPKAHEKSELFDRADFVLEKIEELFTYLFEINKKLNQI